MAIFGPMFNGTPNLDTFLNGSIPFFFAGNVGSVRQYAFYNCNNLKKAYLGNVSSIGTNAFYNCLNLTEVDISGATSYFALPSSNAIPNNANLTIYTSAKQYANFHGNQNWALYGDKVVSKDADNGSMDNFLYKTSTNADTIKIVKGEPIDTTTYATFIRPNVFREYPNDIKLNANFATAIQNSVFYKATNVTLNAIRATHIGYNCFFNASKVTLNAPNVTCVGTYAFQNVINAQLNLCNLQTAPQNMCVNANISGSNFSKIKDAGIFSFFNTKGWSGGLTGLNYVGGRAFEDSSIQSVGFTANAYIDNYAFQNCKSLNSVDFANIRYLGDYAFANCTSLPNPGVTLTLNYIGSKCFENLATKTGFMLYINAFNLTQSYLNAVSDNQSGFKFFNISFATQGLSIGTNAFTCATLNFRSVSGGYIDYVGSNAFKDCYRATGVSAINFPGPDPSDENDIYIGKNAFEHCYIFSNIGCSSGLLYTSHLGTNAFSYTKANINLYHTENASTLLGFYSGITTNHVFDAITNVTVFFPGQIRRFGYKTFYNCSKVTLVEGAVKSNLLFVESNNSFSNCTVNILLQSDHANYLKGNSSARSSYVNSIKTNSTNCTVTGYNVSTNEKIF